MGKTNKQFDINTSLIWLVTFSTSFSRNRRNQGLGLALLGFLGIRKRFNGSYLTKGTHVNLEFIFNGLHFITNISIMVHHQWLIFDSMVVLDTLKRLNGLDYWFRPNHWLKWEQTGQLCHHVQTQQLRRKKINVP